MGKFKNKYRITSARLSGYYYGSNGMNYVTICTKHKIKYFGEIVPDTESGNKAVLLPTIIGEIAYKYWSEIPQHYPFVELDEFIIMPDHIHGILFFNKPGYDLWTPNKFGVQSKNLGAVMRGFKSSTKKYANEHAIKFEWQPRFYDNIIRDEKALDNIRHYIINNPMKWMTDQLSKSTK